MRWFGSPLLRLSSRFLTLEHDLLGKPDSTPDRVRGRLFPDHALSLDLGQNGLHLLQDFTRLLGVERVHDLANSLHVWIERIYSGRFQPAVQILENFIALEHGASTIA